MREYLTKALRFVLLIGLSALSGNGASAQLPARAIQKESPAIQWQQQPATLDNPQQILPPSTLRQDNHHSQPRHHIVENAPLGTAPSNASALRGSANPNILIKTNDSQPAAASPRRPSPCTCPDPASCDGASYPDQASAVNAISSVVDETSPGCFDLSPQNIPADDGQTYQFCYTYTHSSAEPYFALAGVVFVSNATDAAVCQADSDVDVNVYEQGDCGNAILPLAVTSNNWPAYPANTGTVYEVCFDVTASSPSCLGGILSGVCTYVHPHTPTCTLFGGNTTGPSSFNACLEAGNFSLETTGFITSPTYPDIAWGIWLLDDPMGGAGTPGPIPPDPNFLDDANFLGFVDGSNPSVSPYGNGATYYFAPFVYNSATLSFDPACTGLAPGQVVYMNPPLAYNATQIGCDLTIDITGGYPSVEPTGDYSWSYTSPSGAVTTGTGTPITMTANEDGVYTFTLVNDGVGANDCSIPLGSYTFSGCAPCVLYGGDPVGDPNINACVEAGNITLTSTNVVNSPAYPDVGWGIWLLQDPLNATGNTPGPLPPDQNMFDDPNFIGFILGTNQLSPYGNGGTYYIAPFLYNAATTSIDINCTGLGTGYTIYMNPPIGFSANQVNCDLTITLSGGYPSVEPTADYSWSYTSPSGNVVTGTGNPITLTADEDGTYTFTLVNDGLSATDCGLALGGYTFVGCTCEADAGTFTLPDGNVICYDDDFSIVTNGDYDGFHEDGSAIDNLAFGGDGDLYNGVAYSIFTAAPSNEDVLNDPNFLGLLGITPLSSGGADVGYTFQNTTTNLGALGLSPNTPYWVTTTYGFDMNNAGVVVAIDMAADGVNDCFHTNITAAQEVVFLEDVTAVIVESCANGMATVSFTITGGLPAYDGSLFTITGDGPGGTLANGDTYTISVPYGSPYGIAVTDGNGCVWAFGGEAVSLDWLRE